MFSYLTLTVIALGGSLFGYSQWLVDESPWGFWLVPICAVLAASTLVFSRAGQSLAGEQMSELAAAVERALPSP